MNALLTAFAAVLGVLSAPYAAGLTVTVPDRELKRWWTPTRTSYRRQLTLALLAATLAGLAARGAGVKAVTVVLVCAAIVAAPLVVIDAEHRRLPNRLVFTMLTVAVVGLAVCAAIEGDWHRYLRSMEAAALVFSLFFLLVFALPSAFGYGDVKLLAPLSALLGWFGWLEVYYGILAGFILGSVVGIALVVARKAGRKTQIAFGPYLLFGAFLVIAFHTELTRGWANYQ